MDDQRIILGTALGLIDLAAGVLVEGIGAEAIDGLGGNPQEPAIANNGSRPVILRLRKGRLKQNCFHNQFISFLKIFSDAVTKRKHSL